PQKASLDSTPTQPRRSDPVSELLREPVPFHPEATVSLSTALASPPADCGSPSRILRALDVAHYQPTRQERTVAVRLREDRVAVADQYSPRLPQTRPGGRDRSRSSSPPAGCPML